MISRHKIKRLIIALAFYLFNDFLTHFPSFRVRHFYLRHVLRISIGKESAVHMGCFFSGRNIHIGHNSVINRNCYLDGRIEVVIGNNVSLSPEVYILSLTHNPQDEHFCTVGKPVIVCDYTWVGVRAMVLPGVTLSEGCVVGAGAVVTKDIDSYSIVVGVPARVIGKRNRNLSYALKYFPYFDTDMQR